MADVLATDIRCTVNWLLQEAADLSVITDTSLLAYEQSLADGTALDQADKIWYRETTLDGGANHDWNLSTLSLSLFGDSVSVAFVRVKLLFVINLATVVGDELRMGAAAANPWTAPLGSGTDFVRVPADSSLFLCNRKDGWAVTPGLSNVLRLRNPGSNSITYRIVIAGTSA
jgi:hypothetical protein